eukprot:6870913-Pyramimonas_sp.AAC.1
MPKSSTRYYWSHLKRCCRFSLLNSDCGVATVLEVTGIDLETSDASACRIHSSELGLLPDLSLRNYSYCSSHPEMLSVCWSCRGAAGLVNTAIDWES